MDENPSASTPTASYSAAVLPHPLTVSQVVGMPYGGTAATIPGIIQAEKFDLGGEGVGYSDSTLGNFRTVSGGG